MPEPVATPATAQSRGALLKSARDIFWFAALAGVLLVLLHESLFLGKGLVPADGILKLPPWSQPIHPSNCLLADQYWTFVPTQEFVHQQKSFPLWNPVPVLRRAQSWGHSRERCSFRFDCCCRRWIPFQRAVRAPF